MNSLNCLLHHTRSLLMKPFWNWSPRERMKRDKREKKVSGEIHDSRNGEESFFIWGGTLCCWGTGPEHKMVHKGCSSRAECNSELPCRLWWGKESYYPDITSLFSRGEIELNPARNKNLCHQRQSWVKLHFPFISYCWQPSALPSLTSSPSCNP